MKWMLNIVFYGAVFLVFSFTFVFVVLDVAPEKMNFLGSTFVNKTTNFEHTIINVFGMSRFVPGIYDCKQIFSESENTEFSVQLQLFPKGESYINLEAEGDGDFLVNMNVASSGEWYIDGQSVYLKFEEMDISPVYRNPKNVDRDKIKALNTEVQSVFKSQFNQVIPLNEFYEFGFWKDNVNCRRG